MPAPPHIAIAGGGFAGVLTLVNLIRLAQVPVAISLFEEGGKVAHGAAYGTEDPAHLLNVRAAMMGAFPDETDGFWCWLQSAGRQVALDIWPSAAPDGFAPRKLYALYLHSLLQDGLRLAEEKGISVALHTGSRLTASTFDGGRLYLTVDGKGDIPAADFLVLATGNLPPKDFSASGSSLRDSSRYIADIWKPSPSVLYPDKVDRLSATDEIVILGTGLTAVDAILTLRRNGFAGRITAISRSGWFPQPHADGVRPYPAWEWVSAPEAAPKTARGLFLRFRREVQQAAAEGYDWRTVVDSIRPVTQRLWAALSLNERARFTRRCLTAWNVHRHRMSPDLWGRLEGLRREGKLRVLAARISAVTQDGEVLKVQYTSTAVAGSGAVAARLVLNCTGPNYDVVSSRHPLLRSLMDRGLVQAHPSKAGLRLDKDDHAAAGVAPGVIYPLGALRIGEYLECTAVPELRAQAREVTDAILLRAGK